MQGGAGFRNHPQYLYQRVEHLQMFDVFLASAAAAGASLPDED